MTTREYLYDTDESNRRRELHAGLLREPPAPFFFHQSVVLRVARVWSDHVEPRGLGRVAVAPVDVVLDEARDVVLQPDVLFIAAARLSIVRSQVWGAPDLVAAVLSAGSKRHDRTQKLAWYRQYGVRECWLVDPRRESLTIVDFSMPPGTARHATGIASIRSSGLPDLHTSAFGIFNV
jgi:Uma2 family endonuclease